MRDSLTNAVNAAKSAAPCLAFALGLLATTTAVFATEQIGVAVTVHNDVTGKIQAETVKIDGGSDVFGKEIVKTNADSSAKIVLKDNTNLNVGPSSSVTLDNFVFSGPSDYKKAGFNLAKGAFRFTTGASDKRAYDFKTPTASIGVRGTDCVAIVDGKKTHVECSEGKSVVCPAQSVSTEGVSVEDLDDAKKKKCKADDPDKEKKNCGCTRKCVQVDAGKSVDAFDGYVCSAEFTGQTVGEEPMTYQEATASGVATPAIVTLLALGAGAGGIVAATGHHYDSNERRCISGC
jgi:hypothetical protein